MVTSRTIETYELHTVLSKCVTIVVVIRCLGTMITSSTLRTNTPLVV